MKVVKHLPHPSFKITIFKSGFKHLVKFEKGEVDFSFRFLDGEIESLRDLIQLIEKQLIPSADEHFNNLSKRRNAAVRSTTSDSSPDSFPKII